MPTYEPGVLIWGAENIERDTILQAQKCARLPFVRDPVALMPDAHVGVGATVGSVIATENAIIPAAVGVDIGCGMIAVHVDANAERLPDNLDALMPLIEERVPAGVGRGHFRNSGEAERWYAANPCPGEDGPNWRSKSTKTILEQFGTLGSGNHFLEVCLDENDDVWVVLHSGSRGIGNTLARGHIDRAKKLAKQWHIGLEDPDLAYYVTNTPEFGAYIRDMLWAQDYALANRERMMDEALRSFAEVLGVTDQFGALTELERINCHHNFTQQERHFGKNLWVTRKGAIKADEGDRGVIPGSMGAQSFIVTGLGSRESYFSCSHGAGRKMSRKQAKATLSPEDLADRMGDRSWNSDRAQYLVDEHPDAYKDIGEVMAAQADLVSIDHELRQVLNYKG